MTDTRVLAAAALLTGPKLLAGDGTGLIRADGVARVLGVPLADRGALIQWIDESDLWVEPPTDGPLHEKPQAGCIRLDRLRTALKSQVAWDLLPFRCNLEAPR